MAELPVGRAARGKAGVFGTSINPVGLYLQYAGQRQRNKAAVAAQQKAERDKAMDYLDKFDKRSKFTELNQQLSESAQVNVRDRLLQAYESGLSGARLANEVAKWQNEELNKIEEADRWKGTIDGLQEYFEKDPVRYKVEGPESAMTLVRDLYKNPDGSTKKLEDIRATMVNNPADKLKYNPKIMNKEGVIKSWVSGLPQQERVMLGNIYSQMGYGADQIEGIMKSNLEYEMKFDKSTGQHVPVLDENGLPKVIINENSHRLAMADNHMKSIMLDEAGPEKDKQMEWLKKNVRGQGDKVSIDRQVISGKKIDTDKENSMAFGINFGRNVADIEARRDWLDKATSGNRPDLLKAIGNVTKDISAVYATGTTEETKGKKVIAITFPSSIEDSEILKRIKVDSDEAGALLVPGKSKGTYELDISTPQNKRAARQALSEIIDSQLRDSKQAIGTDTYVRYEEEYAKNKQKGASGIKWK